MAEFNPDAGGVPSGNMPDQTGASRGTGPNKAFEELFSGLGNVIESGTKTADLYVQNKIEDQARLDFENLNNETGLSVDAVPAELTNTAEGLKKLASAHNQGKVTQEYYYQRLASSAKSLRARFPGYEKQVDEIVMGVTGVRPANAFRDALLSNMEAANNELASSQDKFQSWVTQAGNIGVVQMAFPDYFQNPEKYNKDEVYSAVARIKGQRETFESQKLAMSNNREMAEIGLNERMNTITSTLLEGSSRSLGMSGADFYTKLNEYSKKGGMSPEEKAQFTNTFEQYMAQAQAQMIQETSDPAFLKMFSPTQLQDMRTAAIAPLGQIRDLINNDQYSSAALLVARNKNLQDKARSALYKTDSKFLLIDTLPPQVSEYLLNDMLASEGGSKNYFDKTALVDVMTGIVSGQDTVADSIDRGLNNKAMTSDEKNRWAADNIKSFTDLLKSDKITPDIVEQTVSQNYGPALDKVFENVSSATDKKGNSQYLRLYNEMFSPEITKKIAAGGPETLKMYTDAAVDKFQAIPEFRRAAQDLSENLDYGKHMKVRYDDRTNRLILEADDSAIKNMGFFSRASNRAYLERAVKAKDAMNQALSTMVPIIEANGGDELEGVKMLFSNMSADLEPSNKGGFISWVDGQLDRLIAGPDARQESDRGIANPDSAIGRAQQRQADALNAELLPEGTFSEVGATSTGTLPVEQISFAIPEGSSLEDAASGPFTGDLGNFVGKTSPIEVARSFDGLNEKKDTQVIASFIKKAAGQDINPSDTAWCAAFVNAVLGASGGKGTGKLNARSFLDWGVPAEEPSEGDVVVFSRGGSTWQGHVGFYVGTEVGDDGKDYIRVLGGNQSNSVKESLYPASRVLGYRKAK